MKLLYWLWKNPWIVAAILTVAVVAVMQFQHWRIDKLKNALESLEATIGVEREHRDKIINAFEDREEKTNDRNEFTRQAAESIAAGEDGPMAPVLLDAYSRLYTRHKTRNTNSE